jgi:hypothetical protein
LVIEVDGATQPNVSSFGNLAFTGTLYVGGAPASAGGATTGFTGVIGHVALVNQLTTIARAQSHGTAVQTGFAGESGTARITRLAGYANIPVNTLDASLTNVAFVDPTGQSVADAINDVVAAEGGSWYIDGSGNLGFHNRNKVVAKTAPDITIAAEYLAEDTAFTTDMQGVINYYEVAAAGTGITQVVRNTVSESGNGTSVAHGRYTGSASYLVQTDAEALDRGNWTVANHAQPAARVGSLTFDLLTMTFAQQQQFMAVETDTWIRITGLPGQTPGSTTADLIVQGISEVSSTSAWTLTCVVVNQSLFSPVWILDHSTYSVLGSTTRLYV